MWMGKKKQNAWEQQAEEEKVQEVLKLSLRRTLKMYWKHWVFI